MALDDLYSLNRPTAPLAAAIGEDPDPYLSGAQRIYEAMLKLKDVGTGGRRLPGDDFQWEQYTYNPLDADQRMRLFQQALAAQAQNQQSQASVQAARAQAGAREGIEEKLAAMQADRAIQAGEDPAVAMARYKQQTAAPATAAPGQAAPEQPGFIGVPAFQELLGTKQAPKTPTATSIAAFMRSQVPETLATESQSDLMRRLGEKFGGADPLRNVLEGRMEELLRLTGRPSIGGYRITEEPLTGLSRYNPFQSSYAYTLEGPTRSVRYRPTRLAATYDRPELATQRTLQEAGLELEGINRLLELMNRDARLPVQ
jgi:hypothetical protein